MIFNEEFDRSLYLMLDSGKENNGLITSVFRGMKKEMFDKIRESLIIYGVYNSVCDNIGLFDDINTSNLRGTFKIEDFTYNYKINLISESLELECIFVFDERLENRIKLILYPLLLEEYKNMYISDSIHLGSVCDIYIDKDGEYFDDHSIVSFDLVKKPFNKFYISSYDINLDMRTNKRVDMDRLFGGIKLDDLKDEYNNKKLVRNKKRAR